jgi:hypothetical protein
MEKKSGSKIRDEHPGSYFRELRNNFWVKINLNSLMRIRIRYLLDPGSGIQDEKIRIQDAGSGIITPDPQHC